MSQEWDARHFHFIGIGGCGMSGLALVIKQLGAVVTGSDQKESIFTRSLRESGIDVAIGHTALGIPSQGSIVYSSAVPADNVERYAAKLAGLPELHRSEVLAELTRSMRTIAICGAHGKTMTAALMAHVLTECGLDPSFIVGGLPKRPMNHGHAGQSEWLVIEADESDRSLLRYRVDLLVVTNIDLDHVRDGGYQNKADVARVIEALANTARVVVAAKHTTKYFHSVPFVEVNVQPSANENSFFLGSNEYQTQLPGSHQADNAALVATTASFLGCKYEDVRRAILSFPGVSRRYDLVGRMSSGATIIDDYAHHPTEIEAVIRATRGKHCNGRIIVVFQPHLFSRTAHFAREFAEVLGLADLALVEDIYASRENPSDWPGVTRSLILEHPGVSLEARGRLRAAPRRDQLARLLADSSMGGDFVLVLGAGDIAELPKQLVSIT
jgi:UDP-N-acetylmuramate--alanine ligase